MTTDIHKRIDSSDAYPTWDVMRSLLHAILESAPQEMPKPPACRHPFYTELKSAWKWCEYCGALYEGSTWVSPRGLD